MFSVTGAAVLVNSPPFFFQSYPILKCFVVSSMNNQDPVDSIFSKKKVVRSSIRQALADMDPIQRSEEDSTIQHLILGSPWFKTCRKLCAYISCNSLREVDTSILVSEILNNADAGTQKRLYVPRVEDKNSNMIMLKISRLDDLIPNSMNILEPTASDGEGNEREDVIKANEPVDLFLLPGLAFDNDGKRLGRGGGYYDSFLKKYQEIVRQRSWKKPLLVGVSYSLQIVDKGVIPVTQNDVFVDAIASSNGVIPISSDASVRMGLCS